MNLKEIARLHIPGYRERSSIILALNCSGYATQIQEVKGDYTGDTEYYVVVFEKQMREAR